MKIDKYHVDLLRFVALASCGVAMTLLTACQHLAETVHKGRPPNPQPRHLSGTESVQVTIVRWVHPQVFEGTFIVDNEVRLDNFILIEQLPGYRIDDEERVFLPNWIGSASVPPARTEDIEQMAKHYPIDTVLTMSFPLAGKVWYKWNSIQGTVCVDDGVLSYTGYLARIED